MQQLTQLIARCKHNSLYIVLGLYSFLKGIALITKKYPQFYYPPEFKGLMNSPAFQYALVLAGILMLAYVLSDYSNERVTGLLIGFIAGLVTVLMLLELEHWYFRGDYGPSLASDLTVLAFTIWTARHRSKR